VRQLKHWFGLGATERVLVPKRIPDALWVAIRHNIMPMEYYAYGLWLPARRLDIDNYLYSIEGTRLFKLLNRPADPDPIADKLAFHEMCRAHRIPTPPLLAAFAPTGKLFDFAFSRPPHHDLFVKAATGHSRPERLRWQDTEFESSRGRRIRLEHLDAYLAHRARTENLTLLVQPVLLNHPDLRVDSKRALASTRLVTGRSLDGEITPIFCYISFGLTDEITAHSNQVALIDVVNGRPIPAPPKDAPGVSMYRYHQFGPNHDFTLPGWDAAMQHVKLAHKACANYVFIGWDVAFTDRGPVILEGNANWQAAVFQTLRGRPLGHTKFADILAARLEDHR